MSLNLNTELYRTNPDYLAFVPKSLDGSSGDTGNEHFLVFDGPDGSLMAVWTQSMHECCGDHWIAFSSSHDEGKTWTKPTVIARKDDQAAAGIASWAFPLVSRSGRIYVLYSRNIGNHHIPGGLMCCITSDDAGATWSTEETLSMPRSVWDNPDAAYPPHWIVWQKPLRLSEGRYLTGFTRWVSPAVQQKQGPDCPRSVVEFMLFENLDDNPDPEDLVIKFLSRDFRALYLPGEQMEEPSLVPLPDDRLFVVMRSSLGAPYWSISSDHGLTWTSPRRLLNCDGGKALKHPVSPCPIYEFSEGEYFLFIHNHDIQTNLRCGADYRRPICLVHGQFRPDAIQPVWFSAPDVFMDSYGIQIGHPDGCSNAGMSLYSSVTQRKGKTVLWYPDRKFFLLGREILSATLENLDIPGR